MRKTKIKTLLLPVLLVLGALNLAAGNVHGFDNCRFPDGRLRVVPQPQEYQLTQGVLALPAQFSVRIPPGEEVIAEVLQQEIRRFRINVTPAADSAFCRFVITQENVPESPEGYKLEITSKGITVSARSNAGLFYGAQTLANLLANAKEPKLECCVINDYPSFNFRGYGIKYLGFTPQFRQLVQLLARLKINSLSISLGDNFPFRTPGFKATPQTIPLDDLREMTAYCRKYHLTVMPCLQVLSHNQWLTRHQDWEKMSEGKPRKLFCSQPCIQNEQAREITLEVMKEYLDIFKSDILYICLDEIFLGPFMQCPRCKGQDAVKLLNDYMAYMRKGLKDAGYGNVKLGFCQDCLYTHASWPWGDEFRKQSMNPEKDLIFWWDYRTNPHAEVMEPFFREKFRFVASGIPGTPANVRNLGRTVREHNGLGLRLVRWYFSNTALLDNLKYNTPESLGGPVQSSEYMWNFRDIHHADFTCDGTYETMRRLHAGKLPPDFSGAAAAPVPFNKLVNAELSSSGGLFPKLDDQTLAEINRELAKRPEKYQLLTTPGGKYYGLCLRGTKKPKAGRLAAELKLNDRTFKGISLLAMTSLPFDQDDYLSVMKYGKKRFLGEPIAAVRFNYSNGENKIVPLRFRRELTDWNQTFGGYFMRWAVRGEDTDGRFFSFGTTDIVNPCPQEPVKSIIFTSAGLNGISPVFLAASLRECSRGFDAAAFNSGDIINPANLKGHQLTCMSKISFTDNPVISTKGSFKGKIRTEIIADAKYGKVLKITVPPADKQKLEFVRINVSVPFNFVPGAKSSFRSCRVFPNSNLHHVTEYLRTAPADKQTGKNGYLAKVIIPGEKDFITSANVIGSNVTADSKLDLKEMSQVKSCRLSFFLKDTTDVTEIYIAEAGLIKEKVSFSYFWTRTTEREIHP